MKDEDKKQVVNKDEKTSDPQAKKPETTCTGCVILVPDKETLRRWSENSRTS